MTRNIREIAGGLLFLAILPVQQWLDRRAARNDEGD